MSPIRGNVRTPPKLFRCPEARCSSRSSPIRKQRNRVNRILTPSGGNSCRTLSVTNLFSLAASWFPLRANQSCQEHFAATARLAGFPGKLNRSYSQTARVPAWTGTRVNSQDFAANFHLKQCDENEMQL